MSNSPQNVTIRLDIQVPVGVAATVHQTGTARECGDPEPFRKYSVSTSDPGVGANKPVRPNAATPGFGTMCAKVTFAFAITSPVFARDYSDFTGVVPITPPGDATKGATTDGGLTWTWQDTNTPANPVPNVKHTTTPGAKNKFVVWYIDPASHDTSYEITCLTFAGITGTTGVCGTGAGSGPGLIATAHSTFPAFWCIEISGFAGHDAIFNSLHALHSQRGGGAVAWDNHGDGKTALHMEMTYSPHDNQWTLRCKLGEQGFTATAVSSSCFGPLDFSVGQVGSLAKGPHGTPRIHAHTV